MDADVQPAWLMRDGEVVAAAEVAVTRRARRRGVIGRDDFHGAFVLKPCRQVHTIGVGRALDVAFCDGDGLVLATRTLKPWRLSLPRWRARFVIEAGAGAFDRWRLTEGDHVEVVDEARGETLAGG